MSKIQLDLKKECRNRIIKKKTLNLPTDTQGLQRYISDLLEQLNVKTSIKNLITIYLQVNLTDRNSIA